MQSEGILTYSNGDQYVGEFKDDKPHGKGILKFSNGKQNVGIWANGEYLPDICDGMGLPRGTSEYKQCIIKLME